MKKNTKTTIQCSLCGCRHSISIEGEQAITPTRGDVMSEAKRALGAMRLGANIQPGTCVALVALIVGGCDDIYGHPLVEDSDHIDLGRWREVYIRWETNRLVEQAMRDARAAARRRRREAKADSPPVEA